MQVTARLVGKDALPWETDSFAYMVEGHEELTRPILRLLHRNPARRMKVAEFARICYKLCKQGHFE